MARFKWRTVAGERGFAPWVRELRGESGVYLIRDARTREMLYVGESHTDRLYETLTRHLFQWNGKGAGPSYHAPLIEAAVVVATTPLDDPVADQFALIEQHRPRDNVLDGHTLWWRMGFKRKRKESAA